jgi:hypothetical protein
MCIIRKYNLNVCSFSKFAFANKYNNRIFLPDSYTVCRHLTCDVPCFKGLSVLVIRLSSSSCLDICTDRIRDMPVGCCSVHMELCS